jgi:dTMP kinase
MFICFEGIDGAGKSTQARMLLQRLKKDGATTEMVADPGTTKIGTAIRQILLHNDDPISSSAQMLLFSAARAELSEYISAQLAKKKTIICDRWLLSTLVYQATINSIDIDLILKIFESTSNLRPDLCVLLDIDPQTADKRKEEAAAKKDRYERANLAEKRKMRAAYLEHVGCRPCAKQIIVLDASQDPDEVHNKIYSYLCEQLGKKRNSSLA